MNFKDGTKIEETIILSHKGDPNSGSHFDRYEFYYVHINRMKLEISFETTR